VKHKSKQYVEKLQNVFEEKINQRKEMELKKRLDEEKQLRI